MTASPIDIIVPVRGDALAAVRCVQSVLGANCETPYTVQVVADDASERAIAQLAAGILRDARVTILRAGRSPEYASLVDRGIALHTERDVVLLLPGAEVAGGWLDRLAAHGARPGAGIVGTFTNAGGSATYPCAGQSNPLPDAQTTATLDALFARTNRGRAAHVPAVSGPCLYVTRACLSALGRISAVGAHASPVMVDLSRRAAHAGFDTQVAGDVFVAATSDELAADVEPLRAEASMPAHLGVDSDDRVSIDTLARRVDVARIAASTRPAIVFISHAWGGGVRRAIDDLAALVREHCDVLYLEPADPRTVKLWWPMAGEAFAAWFRMPEDMPLLVATLRAIGVARLHFHHVHGLPQSIMDLPRDSGLPYDWTLHDYAPICPQYHLVDERGRYCGEPDAAGCAACIAKRPAQWSLDIGAWRAAFGALLRDAERVIAPSQDVADRVARYFPSLAINVWSHPEGVVAPPRRVIRVVTLGTLSPEKGLEVVAGCAEDARARGLPLTFQVLGATTRPIAQAPAVPLTVHGSYDDRALPEILAGEHADVLFFPAQVPETHSYTLSIALATRTPIVASALGAFGERLAGRAHVRLMPWDATPAQWNTALLEAAAEARAISAASVAPIMAL